MTLEDYIISNGIIIRELDLPGHVDGFSFHDDDGRYVVIVNARQGIVKNRETVAHELRHIQNGENENPSYLEYVI